METTSKEENLDLKIYKLEEIELMEQQTVMSYLKQEMEVLILSILLKLWLMMMNL